MLGISTAEVGKIDAIPTGNELLHLELIAIKKIALKAKKIKNLGFIFGSYALVFGQVCKNKTRKQPKKLEPEKMRI